jgi:Carboxypeptidase regulatory-like domain/TonB dependent receptor-like, beta-barrel
MRRAMCGLSIIALLCLVPARAAWAQAGEQGSLTGTVTDAQGGALPGVTAAAVNLQTNVTTTAVTNASGVYLLTPMVNGRYKVTFTLPGFNTAAREVEVRAGDRLRLDLGLAVGGLTEEVSVVAETPLLETTSATRSTVVAQELVENLPTSGRNPFTLSHVVPGVVGEAGNRQSIQLRPFDNGGMDGISINGGVARSNSFTLDGAPNTSREGGTSGSLAFVPSPDAVQEVRVATSTYDAQFGRTGGGTIAVSIRSGTNQFHGTAYYIHRDAALNANLYENIVRGIPKQEIFHYNPGATIGGPIKRDRTFFFYSYEGLKSGIPVGAGQRTPTELERNGDFSQSGFTIYDPLNTVNGVPQPFAGNIIPRSRMDPVALNMMNYMPVANSQPDAAGNNFFPGENSRFDTYTSGILRIDHNLTASHRIFGRYAHNGRRETRAYAGREPEARTGGYHHRWNNVLSVDLTSTLSQTTVSTLRAGWTRHRRLDNSTAEDIGGFDSATLGFPESFVSQIPPRFVPITVTDYGGAQLGQGGGQDGVADDYYAQGQVTNIRGRHQLKAGLEYRTARSLVENPYRGVNLAAFNFTRSFTSLRPTVATSTAADGGNGFASFLLGYAASSNVQLQAPLNWRNSYIAGYLQDDWRLSNRLTVNLGLRWDYEVPTSERDDQVNAGFDYNGVALVCPACPASGLPTELRGGLTFADGAIYSSDLNNFGPRAGFTFQVNDATVVRGGYGLTFLPADTDRGTVTGFSRTTAYVSSLDAGRTPANRLSNPYPTGLLDPVGSSLGLSTALGTNINYHVRDREIPEYHQYSIGVQRQLPWRSVLDVSFVGSATRKRPVTRPVNDLTREQILLGDAYLNTLVPNPFVGLMPDAGATNTAATVQRRVLMRPLPQFGTINEQLVPIGYGNYSSLQVSWEKRLSQGVQLLVGYTGSRTTEALSPLNQGDPLYEQLTTMHRPHVLRLSGGWTAPSFSTRNWAMRYLLGGWQINTVTFFRSGVPVGMPGSVDQIGDPVLENPTTARWFNTCTLTTTGARQSCASATEQPAFQIRAENALDTTGDRLEGVMQDEPFYMDFSFFKNIRVNSRVNFQMRVEMFNATNVVQWGSPNTTVTNTAFGSITENQANDPRSVQLQFRISY